MLLFGIVVVAVDGGASRVAYRARLGGRNMESSFSLSLSLELSCCWRRIEVPCIALIVAVVLSDASKESLKPYDES